MVTDELPDLRKQLEIPSFNGNGVWQCQSELGDLLNPAGIGMMFFDGTGEMVEVNQAIASRLGYSPQEVLTPPIRQLIEQGMLERMNRPITGCRQADSVESSETKFIHRDGREVWVRLTSLPRFDAAGSFLGTLCFLIDITEERRLRRNSDRNGELLNAILSNAHDIIYIKDRQGRYQLVSQSSQWMTGLAPSQVIGKSAAELAGTELAAEIARQDQQVLSAGRALTVEQVVINSPEQRTFLTTKTPYRDNKGEIAGILGIVRDISQLKQAEQSLRRSEERYRTILETSQDGYFECDLAGRITFCNDAFCHIHGQDRETILKTDFRDHVTPETAQRIYQAFHQVYLRGEPLPLLEIEFVKPDGTLRYVEESVSLIRDEHGNAVGFRGIVRETTERRKAEEQIRRLEERFRTIANSAPVMIWMSDPDKSCSFFNQRWLEFTGRTLEQEIGEGWTVNIHPEDLQRTMEICNSSFHGRLPFKMEFRMRRHDGAYRWILDEGVPRYLLNGEFAGFIGASIDITDRKMTEEALRQSEERYRTILENIHDGYYEVDLAGRLTFVNDGLARMFGLQSKEKLLGENMLQFAEETHARRLRKTANRVYRTGQAVSSFVYQLRQSGGARRDVDISLSLVRDGEGRASGFRGIIRDVTESKQAENALRASEERFAKAFSASPEAMCLVTLEEGRFLQINDAWEQCFGLKREDLIGRTTTELNLTAFPFPREQYVELLKKQGRLRDWELSSTTSDGRTRTFLISVEVIELDGQKVILSVNKDISERKRMEEELRISEERFARAFNASPQPMCIIELPSRRYVNVNEALLQNAGFTAKEMIGRTPSELNVWVHPDDFRRISELVAKQGFIRNLETQFRTKYGEIRDFLYSAEQIVFDGKPHLLVVATDITKRKRAEESLRQSEALLHHVIDSDPDWIFVKDLDHRYKLVNQSYADALHLRVEDFIGKNDLELGFPEDQVKGNPEKGIHGFWPADRQVFVTGQIQMIEEDPAEIDGQTHIFNTIKVPLKNDAGQVWGVLGVGRDLTKLRQIEAALRDSEERFAKAFDASPQPMVIFEAPGRRVINVNEAMVRTFGWKAEEMIGRTPADLNIWVDLEQQRRVRALLASQGMVRDLEIKFRTKSGEVREFLYSAETINLKNQPHVLVVANDITERLRAKRALQESENRYRHLFEHSFAGISRSRLDGSILSCNDALARIFGYETREEISRIKTTELYFEQDERTHLLRDLEQYGSVRNYERLMKRRDGSPVWTLANLTLSKDARGEAIIEGVVLDITERKLIEQKLEQSHAEMRALSARLETVREEERTRISREIHDNLGQALTGLKLDFSWLNKNLARAVDESLRRKAIPKLKEITELLEETIQTVRHIATELRPGVLDTLGLSAAIDWQAREFARRGGLKCEINLCREPQRLPAERATALFRIFQEILTNIARHARARQFSVELAETDKDLILTVRDKGIGISEEQLRRPQSLGLIGMRERALIFGGSVRIEGRSGIGTTVTVKIPISGPIGGPTGD